MKKISAIILFVLIVATAVFLWSKYWRGVQYRYVFQNTAGQNLAIEFERDDLIHFEFTQGKPHGRVIEKSPMIAAHDFDRPTQVVRFEHGVKSPKIEIQVDPVNLCFLVTDRAGGYKVGDFCAKAMEGDTKSLTIMAPDMESVYGLGERFVTPGIANGDWMGRVRDSGDDPKSRGVEFGNNMGAFNGAMVGNAQFPVMYAVGAKNKNFALFLDNTFKQRWDFSARLWRVEMGGEQTRGYIFTGPDLPYLRASYMELTGRPPVPPKKAFGLWISEFGFDNWAEMDGKLKSLRAEHFPLDGFVLDLQWFGGIIGNSEKSPMGGLVWDRKNFPEPEEKIKALKNDGIGIMLIEESYVSKGVLDPESKRPVHDILEEKGFLARDSRTEKKATYISYNPWWGLGGMLDWLNPDAGKYWHDWRRQPLIDMGITGHWTDLGEPEMFEPSSFYDNGKLTHAQAHNLFNFKWSESIFDGYHRHREQARPWILSRSGISGIQRFGVAMWSGDIGSDLSNLASQFNVQMQMSFSGMDYFGSDLGGFHRETLKGDLNEMYTQWFAAGALLDVPVRPHTENLCNCKETAPDRIGDKRSNLFNIRQRYELNPYYYSLAHLAFKQGEAVIAPMVLYYQNDGQVRGLADQKLIGRDLLVGLIAHPGQVARDMYLPKGVWTNYHTNERLSSQGEWLRNISAKEGGIFRLPMFAREGAIFPKAKLDELGRNVGDLVVRVYPSPQTSQFVLYEDDGETISYQSGQVRKTLIEQVELEAALSVIIHAAENTYKDAKNFSRIWVEAATNRRPVRAISINGTVLAQLHSRAELEEKDSGWWDDGSGLVVAKASEVNRTQQSNWRFDF